MGEDSNGNQGKMNWCIWSAGHMRGETKNETREADCRKHWLATSISKGGETE